MRDKSIETFLDTIFAALWGLLNPSLQAAKQTLQIESLRFVSAQFESLRARIGAIELPQQLRAELDMAAGRASANVQAQVAAVASWFDPVSPEDYSFSTTEIVEIAAASIRAVHGNFYRTLDVSATDSLRITAANMPVIVDVLIIALDNVARWARVAGGAQVVVTIEHIESGDVLRLRIENDIDAREGDHIAHRLIEARAGVEGKDNATRARSEGGSGLAKLKSMVGHAQNGRLEFGLCERGFFVEVDLSIIKTTVEQ